MIDINLELLAVVGIVDLLNGMCASQNTIYLPDLFRYSEQF